MAPRDLVGDAGREPRQRVQTQREPQARMGRVVLTYPVPQVPGKRNLNRYLRLDAERRALLRALLEARTQAQVALGHLTGAEMAQAQRLHEGGK